MRFRPIEDKLLIKRKEELQTKTGIIIPDTTKEKPLEGTVVSKSKDVDGIEVGETVLFGKYSGNDITIDGEDYILLSKDDIAGILDPE